ncbi:MAG: aminotransferase class V-fold PLP-dependent enzyme [Eudoraea sp.]|uniref:aminotransferase class V-fold PLP-dependent enzyme n=1 Tax=Eudoraea sp. TaxID=1979955 RepID=UPI003C723D85
MIEKARTSFPVLGQGIYANTAAYGLMSDRLMEWRHEHDLDYLVGGSNHKIESLGIMEETRLELANFFNWQKEEVALVPNLSLGINILVEGLDPKREIILLLDNEYPSLSWPFKSRGFATYEIPITENHEELVIETIKTNCISVFALSLVQWLDGFMIDLDFLKRLKMEFPELLIIADGTQFCGAFKLDFQNSGIDVLGGSGYKWLLAGTGNGFMLFKHQLKERCNAKTTGFNASGANLSLYEKWTFNKYFEPGHLDSLAFGSLQQSLIGLNSLGMDHIEKHNHILSTYALEGLLELGLLEPSYSKRKVLSSIFNIAGNRDLYNYLLQNDVVCSRRGKGIRLSFHYYNTLNEVKELLFILKTH